MFLQIIAIFSLLAWTLAVPTVYQFPNNGSFVDNLVIRKNGHLFHTRIDAPQVWSVNLATNNASIVHDFSHDNATITSCFGIAEVDTDVSAVVTGSLGLEKFSSTPGSYALWRVGFNNSTGTDPVAAVSSLLAIPEAEALSALTIYGDLLLIADSPEAAIWKVDLHTQEYTKVISDESMLPAPNAPPLGGQWDSSIQCIPLLRQHDKERVQTGADQRASRGHWGV